MLNGGGSAAAGGWTAQSIKSSNLSSSKSDANASTKGGGGGPYASLLQEDKKRQEELDKLLAGLDQLTETLPDLTSRYIEYSKTSYFSTPWLLEQPVGLFLLFYSFLKHHL